MKKRSVLILLALSLALLAGCKGPSEYSERSGGDIKRDTSGSESSDPGWPGVSVPAPPGVPGKTSEPSVVSQTSPDESSAAESSQESSDDVAFNLVPQELTVKVGEVRTMVVQTENGEEDPGKYTWYSSDKSVAMVDSYGSVTGIEAGNAVITAEKHGKKVNASVIVEEAEEASEEESSKEESSESEASAESSAETEVSEKESSKEEPSKEESSKEEASQTESSEGDSETSEVKAHFSYDDPDDAYRSYVLVSSYLSEEDLDGYDSDDLQLIVNTIYAKNGYIFSTKSIQRFYETQSWYNSISDKSKDESVVSKRIKKDNTENHNLELCVKLRNER